jgi:hypothetical protein
LAVDNEKRGAIVGLSALSAVLARNSVLPLVSPPIISMGRSSIVGNEKRI